MCKNKITNPSEMKMQHIIDMTESRIGKIDFDQVRDYLKTIQEAHRESLEKAFQERDIEAIGTILLMSVYQTVEDEVKKAVYQ